MNAELLVRFKALVDSLVDAPSQHDARVEVRAVQVDIISTPCVESAQFQLLESTSLSSHWFQMSTCTPTPRRRGR